MKKFILILTLILPLLGLTQNYNPFVAQGIVSPAPLLPVEVGGTGQVSWIVGNSGSDPLALVTNQEMLLVITLSRGVPNVADPNNAAQAVASLTGTFVSYFDWTYLPVVRTFTGKQNKVIPGFSLNPLAPASAGSIIIPYKVTQNSSIMAPQNGFNVNITPPAYSNGINALGDDNVSSYTWTSFWVKGTVFNDADGVTDGLIDGTPTDGTAVTVPGTLFVSLVGAGNTIIATVPVNDNGTYDFFPTAPGNYTIVLHTSPGGSTTSANLPNWDNTAEGLVDPGDGLTNGYINISLTNTFIENADFGIDQLPETEDVDAVLDESISMGDKYVLSNMPLNGSDPEDGPAVGSLAAGYTFLITRLPTNALLYYNNVLIAAADVAAGSGTALISNYDPLKLSIAFTVVPETNTQAIFEYASVDAAGLADPSPATYTLTVPSVLPAEGLVLTGKRHGNDVDLSWTTITEEQTNYFIVERSSDGRKYEKIGQQIKAAGNSHRLLQYQLTDQNAIAPVLLYRVKLIDMDGKARHSNVVLVRMGQETYQMEVFPNPATDLFYLTINAVGKFRIQLIDGSGKIVYTREAQFSGTGSTLQLNKGTLASGQYQVKITDGSGNIKTIPVILAN